MMPKTSNLLNKCVCCSIQLESDTEYQEHLKSFHNIDEDLSLNFIINKTVIEKILNPTEEFISSLPSMDELENANEKSYPVRSATDLQNIKEGSTISDHDYIGNGKMSRTIQGSLSNIRQRGGLRYQPVMQAVTLQGFQCVLCERQAWKWDLFVEHMQSKHGSGLQGNNSPSSTISEKEAEKMSESTKDDSLILSAFREISNESEADKSSKEVTKTKVQNDPIEFIMPIPDSDTGNKTTSQKDDKDDKTKSLLELNNSFLSQRTITAAESRIKVTPRKFTLSLLNITANTSDASDKQAKETKEGEEEDKVKSAAKEARIKKQMEELLPEKFKTEPSITQRKENAIAVETESSAGAQKKNVIVVDKSLINKSLGGEVKIAVSTVSKEDSAGETSDLVGEALATSGVDQSYSGFIQDVSETDNTEKTDLKSGDRTCVLCSKTFYNHRSDIITQTADDPDGHKQLSCCVCEKRFYKHRADDLRKHLDAVHRNYRPFICRLCDVSFVSECRLKSHKKTWSHKEKFAALSSEIQEEFSDLVSQDVNLDDNQISADTLGGMRKNIHGKIDSGNVLNCPSCNESFTEKLTLMEHIEYYHRNTCTECWKTFSSIRNLRKHSKRHGKAEICVLPHIFKFCSMLLCACEIIRICRELKFSAFQRWFRIENWTIF